jgi:hypothetical protein
MHLRTWTSGTGQPACANRYCLPLIAIGTSSRPSSATLAAGSRPTIALSPPTQRSPRLGAGRSDEAGKE